MGSNLKYSITNSSVTVVIDGKTSTFQKGAPNFTALRDACLAENLTEVLKHLTVAKGIEQWAKGMFTAQGDIMSYQGEPLPAGLNSRILEMACRGEDATPILRFWERLVGCPEKGLPGNPSMRSVNQLWTFLQHEGIPIDQDGFILAYKGVNCDYMDKYTGRVPNTVGTMNKMPRNKVSDDPDVACHYGFHCGALAYASQYAGNDPVIIVKVDPADVVCVPKDCSCQKVRCCAYTVVSIYGGNRTTDHLPSTTMPAAPPVSDEELVDLEDEDDDDLNDEGDSDPPIESPAPTFTPPTAPAVPKRHKLDEGTESTTVKDTSKTVWKDDFDALDEEGLFNQGIVELRKYASHDLKIAGAFKIPGGKPALIVQILRVRDANKPKAKKAKR